MRTLGRYELLRPLARGGMAEVYLARRRVAGVEKRLVIKRLRRERISDPRFLDLFVKEAQLSMTLVQQNIVPVFDFGRIGDDVFLAMEHIDGKDLGSTLARARGVGMPPLVAAFVVSECCHALHHAHSGVAGRQVVHRDVTPRNVLLSWAGEVKLADFGIASAMGAVDGSLVGTPGYMAPEQARGEPLDARADLYSLGLVLWEMLTGGHVRRGADAATLLEAAKRNALPPVPDGLPEALAALLRQATALSPAARIDSARTMADALDTFMVGERARHGGAAPAQQLAAWLAERWADAGEDPLELPEVEGGRMLTFLDDGAEGVLGTGTLRSMAVTSGPEGEPPDAPQGGPSAQGSEPPQAAPVGARGKAAAAESKEPASLLTGSGSGLGSGSGSGAGTVAGLVGVARPAAPRRRRALAAVALVAGLAAAGVVAGLRRAGGPGAAATAGLGVGVDAGAPVDAAGRAEEEADRAAAAAARRTDAAVGAEVDAAAEAAIDDAQRAAPDARRARGEAPPPRARRDAGHASALPVDAAAQRARLGGDPPRDAAAVAPRRPFTIGAKPWANVTIDDDPQRYETPATVVLALGKHRLRFENPALGISREVIIEVSADGPASYVHVLQ